MTDKQIGAIMGEVLKSGIEALGLSTMTRTRLMSEEEAKVFFDEVVQLIYGGEQHGYSWQ